MAESRPVFDAEAYKQARVAGVDVLLLGLVEAINGTDKSLFVNLTVGGLIISGELVSTHRYIEALGKMMTSGLAADKAADVQAEYQKVAASSTGPGDEHSGGSEPRQTAAYIHLRNAHILRGDGELIPHNEGIWWRGSLRAVDGFWLGILTSERR